MPAQQYQWRQNPERKNPPCEQPCGAGVPHGRKRAVQKPITAGRLFPVKLGAPPAITAAAHKLARIVFHMLSTRDAYDEAILHKNERGFRARAEARLRAQAKSLGYSLVATAAQTAQPKTA